MCFIQVGSAHKMDHKIFIWDKKEGSLVKMLEGPKEQLNDLAWHPVRAVIASAAAHGSIYIWATNHQENWSAFAPDFKELDENVEYEEREDEFDIIETIDELIRQHKEEEDVDIDVTTVDKVKILQSDDDEELFYLPTHPDKESVDGDEAYREDHENNGSQYVPIKRTTKKITVAKKVALSKTRKIKAERNSEIDEAPKSKKMKYNRKGN